MKTARIQPKQKLIYTPQLKQEAITCSSVSELQNHLSPKKKVITIFPFNGNITLVQEWYE